MVTLGVVVLFFGVAFLLKYAVDRGLLSIELRLIAAALGGIGMLVFGWRTREAKPPFSRVLQGGGVGVLYLTVFAAYRLYDLIPSAPTFLLLVAFMVLSALLAVLQDSRALAMLGTVGGFLAPVLASTGQGSHVALFSYYIVLNIGILSISWFKSWRSLNLAGFVFTFVLSGGWAVRYYRPEFFSTTEPFLIAFFAMYVAIAVMFALRQEPRLVGLPGLFVPGEDLDTVEAGFLEGLQEQVFAEGPGNASAPELGIRPQVLGDVFVADDVGDHHPAAPLENAMHLLEEHGFGPRIDQVEYAVAHDDVNGGCRDRWMLSSLACFPLLDGIEVVGGSDRVSLETSFEPTVIKSEILNLALMELDVVIAERVSDRRSMLFSECQHVVVHVDANDTTFGPHDLRRDVANLAPTASEIQNRLSLTKVFRRIAAAVVPLEYLLGNDRQIPRVVVHRAAELGLALRGGQGVA